MFNIQVSYFFVVIHLSSFT